MNAQVSAPAVAVKPRTLVMRVPVAPDDADAFPEEGVDGFSRAEIRAILVRAEARRLARGGRP